MNRILLICFSAFLIASCGRSTDNKTDRRYQLTGRVTALEAKNHVATVDAATIPNFMDAMTMDYPVKSEAEFKKLQVGEQIKATITVHQDSSYDLTHIARQDTPK